MNNGVGYKTLIGVPRALFILKTSSSVSLHCSWLLSFVRWTRRMCVLSVSSNHANQSVQTAHIRSPLVFLHHREISLKKGKKKKNSKLKDPRVRVRGYLLLPQFKKIWREKQSRKSYLNVNQSSERTLRIDISQSLSLKTLKHLQCKSSKDKRRVMGREHTNSLSRTTHSLRQYQRPMLLRKTCWKNRVFILNLPSPTPDVAV